MNADAYVKGWPFLTRHSAPTTRAWVNLALNGSFPPCRMGATGRFLSTN
jgi:hypothetical protein